MDCDKKIKIYEQQNGVLKQQKLKQMLEVFPTANI